VYLLDSSVAIEMIMAKQRGEASRSFIGNEEVAVTPFTIHELIVGLEKNDEARQKFLDSINIVDYNKDCSKISGNICKDMMEKGSVIGVIDAFIASVAIANNLKLITFDKDFLKVEGLNVKVL